MQLGQGSLMAKVDIESAYRLLPVHAPDCPLTGIMWEGVVFMDPMLPFGLRSAHKIFNTVPDSIWWQHEQRGVEHIAYYMYLDNFLVWGNAGSIIFYSLLSPTRKVHMWMDMGDTMWHR